MTQIIQQVPQLRIRMNMCQQDGAAGATQNTTSPQKEAKASPAMKRLKMSSSPIRKAKKINDLVLGAAAVIKEEDSVLSDSVIGISANQTPDNNKSSNAKSSDKSQVSKGRSPLRLEQFEDSLSDEEDELKVHQKEQQLCEKVDEAVRELTHDINDEASVD